jgi:hypothetical protein
MFTNRKKRETTSIDNAAKSVRNLRTQNPQKMSAQNQLGQEYGADLEQDLSCEGGVCSVSWKPRRPAA